MNYKKSQFNFKFKITALVLIKIMLFSQLAWAGTNTVGLTNKLHQDTLSPQIQINNGFDNALISAFSYLNNLPLELESTIKVNVSVESADTNLLMIEDISNGFKTKISLLKNNYPNYSSWISGQYGDMALSEYPHLSTKLMINGMVGAKGIFKDAVVLEAGCGDGIVSVLASRLGARQVYAVENQKSILKIARETARLNISENIEFFEGNFIFGKFKFSDKPTVLLLNIGEFVAEHLSQVIAKYPSIKHIVITSENIHGYGGKESLIELILKLKKIGQIKLSTYLEQDVYYADLFTEGCWNFVVDVNKDTNELAEKNEVDIKKLKESILYNSLIQKFFRLSAEDSARKIPWSLVLDELLEPDADFMKDVIIQVEANGEDWITNQAEIIRETHSSRSSYEDTSTDTGGSWTAFIDKTKNFEVYNLAHLLAHSIGFVKNYIDIDEVEKAKEFFKTGYIILRAIEIESRKAEKQQNAQIQMFQENAASLEKSMKLLPNVELKKLSEYQAFIMADRLSELFENKNIHFLDDALDISPKHAYAAKVIDNIEVVFLGQDPDTLYSSIGVSLVPDTYYIAVTEGENIIGYGAIDAVVMREDDSIGLAFRIFDEYRHRKGKISAQIFKSVLAGAREIFGQKITKFILPSHQINGERGIESSAVIFYLKLGFKLTDKNLQALWANKYSPKVSAGEQLDKTVIEKISQSRIIFDLNELNIPHDSMFSKVKISVLGVEHNLMLINQAI